MQQSKWFPYLVVAAGIAAVLIAAGVSLAAFLPFVFLLACPLMMVFMMRGMGGMHGGEDHTGHGCEHDPTRRSQPPAKPDR
jgi:hypothetical protein